METSFGKENYLYIGIINSKSVNHEEVIKFINEYGDLNPSFLDNSNLVGGILLVFMNVFIAEYTISCLSVNLLSILLYLSLIQNVENKSVI